MICKHCMKNVAKIKFSEVVDGRVIQHHLCAECYEAWQRDASGFTLDVPKPTQRAVQESSPPRSSSVKSPVKRCDTCGTSLTSIMETASVGCASCYNVFGKEIESILEGLHRGLVHRGKSMQCDDERARLAQELQAKRFLLRSMLKEENYEEAARLRDEIARLEDCAVESDSSIGAKKR